MQKLGDWVLKVFGWKVVGQLPPLKKYVVIVAPHTSNWDFPIGLFTRFSLRTKINFLAKKQLFFFPLGLILKGLGGAPVDRSKNTRVVEKVVELFRTQEEFKLAITPEGTRAAVKRWKAGFYHIAEQAGVPIIMVGLDYKNKEVKVSEPFSPSGDLEKDFPVILDYFRQIEGRYPKEIPTL